MKPAGLLFALGIVVAAGCASSGGGAGGRAEDAGPSAARGSNVINQDEIAATGLANMEDVIQRLRPQYLRVRGRTSIMNPKDEVAVYVDDVHSGTASFLRSIGANSVRRVEYVSGPDTGFRFGMSHTAGVIHIITK